ncbi:TPA: Golgi apyrase [Trebouxia sp. C0004]
MTLPLRTCWAVQLGSRAGQSCWAVQLMVNLLLLPTFTLGALQRAAPMGTWLGSTWQSTVVIDAGSTGSRIHIYQYKGSRAGLALVQQPVSSLKVTPGLSEYARQPENVGQSLGPLLEYAYKQIPLHQHSLTEVHLFATAGFRVLAPRPAAELINSCRAFLATSHFKFQDEWAAVMSGPSEGVFGWVAANYASGALQGYALRQGLRLRKPGAPSAPFVGVFELGGASAQVTFRPDVPTKAASNIQLLKLPNLQLPLYTHSFLGFGQEAALTLASTAAVSKMLQATTTTPSNTSEEARDPCLPVGYSRAAPSGTMVGSGNFDECRAVAKALIAGQCQDELCPIGDSMPVELQGPFIAMENFHYTAQFLGLPVQPTLEEIAEAGQHHCALAWPALQQRHGTNVSAEHLLHFCFSAAYIVALLHDGFKLGMQERRLRFTNYVEDPQGNSMDIDWTLGAVVVQTALMQSPASDRRSFLQPYDHSLHSRNSFCEHSLAVVLLVGFVAALAVRLAGRSRWLRRMLRKHAGGTQALVMFERCLDCFTECGQSKSPRRASKPG